MLSPKFGLGDVLRDEITGFEGVACVEAKYLTGCIHYGLCPQRLHDGKPIGWEWFDQDRLTLVARKVIVTQNNTVTGGPCPNPPQL